jgi:hypothetical protein
MDDLSKMYRACHNQNKLSPCGFLNAGNFRHVECLVLATNWSGYAWWFHLIAWITDQKINEFLQFLVSEKANWPTFKQKALGHYDLLHSVVHTIPVI